MPLNAVIVDDEALARRELRYLLERAGEVDVVAEASNGLEAVSTVLDHAPDVLFMDVQMPGLDGFGVLKRLMEDRSLRMPEVIFATAFDQYAVRAFEVNAIDYLLKPFEEKRVALAVEKARMRRAGQTLAAAETQLEPVAQASAEERLESLLKLLEVQAQQAVTAPKQRSGKVVVRSAQRLLLVDQREICFASIEEGAISVVTPTLEGMSNVRTLEELLDQLDPETFWRAHRSFVVNIQHIREVVPWFKSSYLLRMDDRKHTEIPVARAQVKRLRELFNL
ncbi:LytR/AlgR family response regulator transcription factor [Terriglobus roseus]|uniref:Two component transcriptional regulator, LytTR family n=1 Tax=Terriglobus roseus TaxID=392734 RepID=A0A1G7P118_9BACT|nr:LytTR family DNA-binding domain-containing protein [Terriglobus roseus]SDF80012.1 two component transcriptional regulator, LytTR family [Terriglobus roseus]